MPFALSDADHLQFLTEVNPDSLGLPQWGGIAQWHGRYILMFLMPNSDNILSDSWALSDISDGIPFGNTTINVQTYLQNIPSSGPTYWGTFWGTLPANFMAQAAEVTAAAGALASETVVWTAQQVGAVVSGITAPVLNAATVPLAMIAAIAIAVLLLAKEV
jgi:hypothetical protein